MLLPLKLMWSRVELARNDSDTTLFLHLLYAGEMLTKLVTAGFLSAVADDREGHRYRLAHKLIRADGIGDWPQALDEALTGPPAQHLLDGASEDRRSLTERCGTGTWQHEAVRLLTNGIRIVLPEIDAAPVRLPLRQWFGTFATLRNKTRAHGATTPEVCARLSPALEQSIILIIDHLPLLQRPWAYLHRNLSGKFRVIPLGGDASSFDGLKTAAGSSAHRNLVDGVHIDFGKLTRVELMETNVDVGDFYLPNGGFKGKSFELLSLITDNRKQGDASPYVMPATERPQSETQGKSTLDVVGTTLTNIPPASTEYVSRKILEEELYRTLKDDRHPVITLVGSGGIGKTSLAIAAITRVAHEGLFEVAIWFSARDIDLLPEGPKVVAPHVLTQDDIADEFARLLDPVEAKDKTFKALTYLGQSLTRSPTGKPILFVFDNFETVRSPGDLFVWLDTHVRLPNKVLITTRYREFKADYPVEVSGMSDDEARRLMEATAQRLGISDILDSQYMQDIFEESEGHPYIMKILLGELAKSRKAAKVERVVAAKEEILDALFERTYVGLQPASKRVFLTLCSWRSLVPQFALEAVLLRPSNEKMDVRAAIEELVRSSFVEQRPASDGTVFLDVALVAHVFGRRKLEISPMKAAIDADVDFLQQIGATSTTALRHGVQPRIERLFKSIAARLSAGRLDLNAVVPSLEFICRHYPPAWPMLARLHEESGAADSLECAADCLRRFLEQSHDVADQREGWNQLVHLYRETRNWTAAAHAGVRACALPDTPFSVLSNTANWLNNLLRENYLAIDTDEKRLLYRELAQLMERHKGEADATDLSRLAWLHLHLRDVSRAMEIAEEGLAIDEYNEHCLRLVKRLSGGYDTLEPWQ